jgi:integrase
VIEDYIGSMRSEINISDKYKILNRGIFDRFARFHKGKHWKDMTQKDVISFLDSIRKAEPIDPLHKWIGTYNLYVSVIVKFFKWLYYPDIQPAKRPRPACVRGLMRLPRKEVSPYKPSDLWTADDDLLFLKYCPNKRDRCYHMISRDSSCRPHELLNLRIKDVMFKMVGDRQYAEILVNGKTGSRHIPLISSIPYLKDWLDDHPMRANPNGHLMCSMRKSRPISTNTIFNIYQAYHLEYFPKLLSDPRVNPEDKPKIQELLKKPWNPYIRRHSALTDKSKILKEHILRQHAGWSSRSQMPEKYIHYYGNESSESILEAYGLKPKHVDIDKMKPKQCPNCNEANKIDSKFCVKCRMILSYDAYTESMEEKNEDGDALTILSDQVEKLTREMHQLKLKQT